MVGAIFPGQGSQFVGMGEFLIEDFPRAKKVFEEASDLLGYDMIDLCLNGPDEKLKMTEFTQPALLTISFATYRVVKDMEEMRVGASAGHSVGEYAALVASGVITFAQAIKLVQLRGQLMQDSVPVGKGGMLAVMGLEPREVRKMCKWACEETKLSPLEPANYNSPAQTVISGNLDLINWVRANFTPEKIESDKKKVKLIPLKVSAPFHCSMMKTAEQGMEKAIHGIDFKAPVFGIAQNVTGQVETDPETIKTNIIKQISSPVRWVECVDALKDAGVKLIGEFGPGKVLTGLIKKIDPETFMTYNMNSIEDLKSFDYQVEKFNEQEERRKLREEESDYGDD